MTISTTASQLRVQVQDILLAFDRRFTPGGRGASDVLRQAYRLRFDLARYEEFAHAAVMQSALYSESRLQAAEAILTSAIDEARALLASLPVPQAGATTRLPAFDEDGQQRSQEKAA